MYYEYIQQHTKHQYILSIPYIDVYTIIITIIGLFFKVVGREEEGGRRKRGKISALVNGNTQPPPLPKFHMTHYLSSGFRFIYRRKRKIIKTISYIN